ncbi:MAG: ROK family protein [Erysipelotrichaceae bacterium]
MLVCFDLGGSSLKAALISEDNVFLEKESLEVMDDVDFIFQQMIGYTKRMQEKYAVDGIAISAPGSVDVHTGIIHGASAFKTIHGPNFIEELHAATQLDVAIENDANCAALAEMQYGAGKQMQDACFMVVGTGIGGTIVKDKKVHHGAHLYGGEFGYMLIAGDNGLTTLSHCGAIGAIVKAAKEATGEKDVNGRKIFERAQAGDAYYQGLVDSFYKHLAIGVINVQYSYDPEAIILGGAISTREDFIATLKQAIAKVSTAGLHKIEPVLLACEFGNDANLLGAKVHFLQQKLA